MKTSRHWQQWKPLDQRGWRVLLELTNTANTGKELSKHLRSWVEEQEEHSTVQTVVQDGAVAGVRGGVQNTQPDLVHFLHLISCCFLSLAISS